MPEVAVAYSIGEEMISVTVELEEVSVSALDETMHQAVRGLLIAYSAVWPDSAPKDSG